MFGLADKAYIMAVEFTFWTAIYAPAMLVTLVFNMSFRAVGNATTPLWAAIIGVLLSVLLGAALTFGWAGLPKLGLAGLAIGGGIGTSLTIIAFLLLWALGWLSFKPYSPLPDFIKNGKILTDIGMPAAFEQAFFQAGMLLFMIFLGSYGNAAYAAYGIGLSILGLIIVVAFSFSISAATLVSQHLGAGDKRGAYNAGWRTMRTCVYLMLCSSIFLAIFAEEIARFMIDDPEVIGHMVNLTYVLCLSLPFMGVEFSMAGSLRGAGDTRFPMMVTIFSMLLTRLLMPLILVKIGADVIWLYAMSLMDFSIKSSLNMWRFRKKAWLGNE